MKKTQTDIAVSKDDQTLNRARLALQLMVATLAFVPVLAGLAGVLFGPGMIDDPDGVIVSTVSLDSHYRYLSGLLMAIGFGFWSTIPGIENKTSRFQLLTAIVFVGGLGRLYAMTGMGVPDTTMLLGLGMELIVTPLLAFCQFVIARRSETDPEGFI